jgi:hypothetical protein
VYCSAFVKQLFLQAGIDLVPGVAGKNTTPEDISRTLVPHITYLLQTKAPPGKLSRLKRKIPVSIRARLREIKRQGTRN